MIKKPSKAEIRRKKHWRMRKHLNGTAQRPRLSVFRSDKHMYAQIIDDLAQNTLVSASVKDNFLNTCIKRLLSDDLAKVCSSCYIVGLLKFCFYVFLDCGSRN